MKTLKITLLIAVLFTTFTSCTKEDLNEDDVLTLEELYAEDNNDVPPSSPGTGGTGHD